MKVWFLVLPVHLYCIDLNFQYYSYVYEKKILKFNLIFIGRFEILTGGWVMTDEANVELFSMVDQLVEGHQWLLHTLNFKPKSSWSVDPFGHGAAFPYVLKASGVDGKFY